jgi:hypothetical protein
LDILLIPVISVDPECFFSGTKIIISDRRNRLGIYTIKALEYLKSWLKIQMFLDVNNDDKGIEGENIEDLEQGGAIIMVVE